MTLNDLRRPQCKQILAFCRRRVRSAENTFYYLRTATINRRRILHYSKQQLLYTVTGKKNGPPKHVQITL